MNELRQTTSGLTTPGRNRDNGNDTRCQGTKARRSLNGEVSHGDRRRSRRDPSVFGPRGQGNNRPPGREVAEHRGQDGSTGQDFPDERLLDMHSGAQDGRLLQPSQHERHHLRRGRWRRGEGRSVQGQGAQEGPVRGRDEVHWLRRMPREVPDQGPERVRDGPGQQEGHLHPVHAGRPQGHDHRQGELHNAHEGQVRELQEGLQEGGHQLRDEGPDARDRGRVHHRRHGLRHLEPDHIHRVRLRQVPERLHGHGVRADDQRRRSDPRPHQEEVRREEADEDGVHTVRGLEEPAGGPPLLLRASAACTPPRRPCWPASTTTTSNPRYSTRT